MLVCVWVAGWNCYFLFYFIFYCGWSLISTSTCLFTSDAIFMTCLFFLQEKRRLQVVQENKRLQLQQEKLDLLRQVVKDFWTVYRFHGNSNSSKEGFSSTLFHRTGWERRAFYRNLATHARTHAGTHALTHARTPPPPTHTHTHTNDVFRKRGWGGGGGGGGG